MRIYILFLAFFMGSAQGCCIPPRKLETDREIFKLKALLEGMDSTIKKSRSNLVPKGDGPIPPLSMSEGEESFELKDNVDLSDEWTLEFNV